MTPTTVTSGIRRTNPQTWPLQQKQQQKQQQFGYRVDINAAARYEKDRPYGRRTTTTTATMALNTDALESVDAAAESSNSSRFFNQTVRQALFQARREFVAASQGQLQGLDKNQPVDADEDVLEADVSAATLVALALSLPWDTGFGDLQRLLQQGPEQQPSLSLDTSHSESISLPQQRLSLEQSQLLHAYMQRRLHFEPLQYICGQWDFWQHTFIVRPPLLCPRPETEQLVQLVWDDIELANWQRTDSMCRILDVGCGTGCIGIALAAMSLSTSSSKTRRANSIHVTAIDVEPVAVATAAENAARILLDGSDTVGIDATITATTTTIPQQPDAVFHYECDRYRVAQIAAQDYTLHGNDEPFYHVVVSNPPYIPAADMDGLPRTVRCYESRTALYGGSADGLHVIRAIVQQLPRWCHVNAICWLEVDPSQPPLLKQWLLQNYPQPRDGTLSTTERTTSDGTLKRVEMVSVHQDFCGRDRFVKLRVVV
jgi:release factor glutamine methyltransferase